MTTKDKQQLIKEIGGIMPDASEINYAEDNFYAGEVAMATDIIKLIKETNPNKGL